MTFGGRTVAALGLSLVTALAVVVGAREVFAATVVTPSNMNGWASQVSDTGVVELVPGPLSPPIGSGSARLFTGSQGS
jgi:hypothetical protein